MQSLELVFDPGTEAKLRGEWDALRDAGLPSSARNVSPSNRPHVTVAVAQTGLDLALPQVRSAVAGMLPLPVTLGGFLIFPSPRGAVLSRSIVVSGALLRLHALVAEAVSGKATLLATAQVDAWTPHATIARRLRTGELGQAIALLPPGAMHGAAEELRLWDSEARVVTPVAGSSEEGVVRARRGATHGPA